MGRRTAVNQHSPGQPQAEARMGFDEAGIKVSITNRGRTVVTLVTPETGSEIGMRTPIIKWRVIQVTDTGDRDVTPETGIGDFYIILSADDVWDLPPGATKSLHLLPGLIPDVAGPGQYRLRFEYENRPSLRWRASYQLDELEITLVRAST